MDIIKSDHIDQFAAAFAKAQKTFRIAEEDSNNPHFKSKFASYPALYAACVPSLNEAGIGVSHLPVARDGKVGCVTLLVHESGQYMGSEFVTAVKDNGSQAAGSALSYAKRYSLAGACALRISDDVSDDDGEQAEGRSTQTAKKKAPAAAEPAKTSGAEARDAVAAKLRDVPSTSDLAARKAAVLGRFKELYAGQDRIHLKNVLERTIPDGDIRLKSIEELEKLENWLKESDELWSQMDRVAQSQSTNKAA